MSEQTSAREARDALDAVAGARREVAREVGLPRAYWWTVAAGWILVGVFSDLNNPWLIGAAPLAFGAGHAALAGRLLSGRQRTRGLRVSAAVAGRRPALVTICLLAALTVTTIAVALALHADGMRHPSIGAAVLVAVLAAGAGPDLSRMLSRMLSRTRRA